MSFIAESYECTLLKSGAAIFTFDTQNFRPGGELISARVDARSVLTLTWSNGVKALLPDVRGELAEDVAAAPSIGVRWTAGGLFWGADLQKVIA